MFNNLFLDNTHKHKTFSFKKYSYFPFGFNIDKAVEILIEGQESLEEQMKKLVFENLTIKSDLAAIHADYRDYLCGDCCHQDVCKIKDSVKYGFECPDKPVLCTMDFEEEETEANEKQEATNA